MKNDCTLHDSCKNRYLLCFCCEMGSKYQPRNTINNIIKNVKPANDEPLIYVSSAYKKEPFTKEYVFGEVEHMTIKTKDGSVIAFAFDNMAQEIDRQKILDVIDKLEAEHPYHVYGKSDTCNPYNEGWCDALNKLESMLEDM